MEELEIRGRTDKLQTTELIKSLSIFGRKFETRGNWLTLRSLLKVPYKTGVKTSEGDKYYYYYYYYYYY